MGTRAVIYVRLSVDQHGTSAGVARQEESLRALSAQRGYEVAAVLGHADASATKGDRPGFAELLHRARAGEFDVVLAWSLDRLSRSMADTGALLALGLPIETVASGTTEANAEGELRANIGAAVARFEGRRKVERMHETYAEWRAAGKPHSGPRLPGLDRDEELAPVIAAGWRAVLDGVSLSELSRRWGAAGVRTQGIRAKDQHGKPIDGEWQTPPRGPNAWDVRRWLSAQRYAGRLADGSAGAGEGLVDPDTFDALQQMFDNRTRAPRPGGRIAYALPVVGRCGRCGGRVKSIRNGKGGRHHAYACERHDLVRNGAVPDLFVFALVAERLAMPDAAELLSPQVDVRALLTERDAVKQRWDNVADLVASGDLDKDAARKRTGPLKAKVEELTRRIAEATAGSPLEGLTGADAAVKLAKVTPRRLARVYSALFAEVILEPAPAKGYRYRWDPTAEDEGDPGVRIVWKGEAQ